MPASTRPGIFYTVATTLTVLHPKGGVGRSTTVYTLGVVLALHGHRVALIDRDQGQHLSRIFDFYPARGDDLVLGEDRDAAFRIVDSAPEVDAKRAIRYLRQAEWALVPVKGPEAGSVLALPLLLEWLEQAQSVRLLGFVPTMYKPRRGDSRQALTVHFGETGRFACTTPAETTGCTTPTETTVRFRPSYTYLQIPTVLVDDARDFRHGVRSPVILGTYVRAKKRDLRRCGGKPQRQRGVVLLMTSSPQRDQVRGCPPAASAQPIAPTAPNIWQDRAPVELSSTRSWGSDALGAGGSCEALACRIEGSQIAYRTRLGVQVTGDSRPLLERLPAESVDLIVTSPPFALLRRKAYGNEDQADYVAWLLEFGKAAHRVLKDTGSFVLDIGGAYQRGVPVRSLYPYRVLLGFCDDLGYHLAEEFHWHNPSKLPSPIEWVNKRKIRAKDSVNNVWWFSKTEWPKADIRRVRRPYSARMRLLLKDPAAYYDPKERPSGHGISSRFGQDNGGSLPSNLLTIPNSGSSSRFQNLCKELHEPVHPARFPGNLPQFFIRMLTDPGDVVVDIFSGSNTTGEVAEAEGRRWLSFELDRDYACLSALRFIPEAGPLDARRALNRLRSAESLHILFGSVVD